MQVTKLGRTQGLAPVGRYFEAIAHDLRDANDREAQRRACLDEEDRDLEDLYRRRSTACANRVAEARH